MVTNTTPSFRDGNVSQVERLGFPAGGFRNGCKITPNWIFQVESQQLGHLHGRLLHTLSASMESYREVNSLDICLCPSSAYTSQFPEFLLTFSRNPGSRTLHSIAGE